MNDALIFPRELEKAAKAIKDLKSLGRILKSLVGEKLNLSDLEAYIVKQARAEITEHAAKAEARRKQNLERKRRERGKKRKEKLNENENEKAGNSQAQHCR